MDITAKVICTGKTPFAGGEVASLSFGPNYADGANAAWAYQTPSLSLSMSVRNAVAESFTVGQAYTLTFSPDTPPAEATAPAADAQPTATPPVGADE